jgi:hypothetical protein
MTTVSWPVPFFHPKIVNNTAPQNYPIWDTFGSSQSGDESQSLLLLINALPDRLAEAFPIEASDHTPGMYDPDANLFDFCPIYVDHGSIHDASKSLQGKTSVGCVIRPDTSPTRGLGCCSRA